MIERAEMGKLVEAYAEMWYAFPSIAEAIERRAEEIVEERARASRETMRRDNLAAGETPAEEGTTETLDPAAGKDEEPEADARGHVPESARRTA